MCLFSWVHDISFFFEFEGNIFRVRCCGNILVRGNYLFCVVSEVVRVLRW